MERADETLRRRVRAICLAGTATLTLGTIFKSNVVLAATDIGDEIDDSSLLVTSGIRASLLTSLEAKKEAPGVVDVISAADIGDFPDSNLAAAMARTPGVTASHEAPIGFTSTGDATAITVRGFGPTFNTTLSDGRQLASATGTRAFDFSSMGAEFVKAVYVLKTPDVTLSSDAIGATVNIINRLPFDKLGLQLNGSISGTYASGEGKTTPNSGVLFSDTFLDDTFGVLADVSYAQTKTKGNHLSTRGWVGTHLNCSQYAVSANCVGFYDATPSWFMQDYSSYQEENDEQRTSGRLALQWRPAGNLLFTVNDDYSKDTLSQHRYGYNSWFDGGALTNVVRNDNGTVVSFIQPDTSPTLVDASVGRVMENNDVGINIKWDATEHQSYMADYSSSVSKLNPKMGTQPFISPDNKDTVSELKLQGTWKGDELKLDYGAQFSTNRENLDNLVNFNSVNSLSPTTMYVAPIQSIDESTSSFYLNGMQNISFGSTVLSINAGIREERTGLTSQAFNQQLPTALTVQATDHTAFLVTYAASSMPISQTNSYDYLLPNLDLNFNIADALKLRLDVSRTLTRPPLSSISPDISVGQAQRVGALYATGGNPSLLPYLSYNRDVGLEWYYTKNSYLAVDGFVKNISNAILSGFLPRTVNDVIDPTTNQPAQFEVGSQINGDSFRVSGVELSLQHSFGDSGFGFQANATFLNTDKPYDRYDLLSSGFAVTGLTNSWNLVGFYDKLGFQFRVAVNHQNESLSSLGQQVNNSVFGYEPTYTSASTQWDADVRYILNLHASIYLDGQNLNNAMYRTHGRFAEQILDVVDTGRRFTVGICYKL